MSKTQKQLFDAFDGLTLGPRGGQMQIRSNKKKEDRKSGKEACSRKMGMIDEKKEKSLRSSEAVSSFLLQILSTIQNSSDT